VVGNVDAGLNEFVLQRMLDAATPSSMPGQADQRHAVEEGFLAPWHQASSWDYSRNHQPNILE